LNFTINTSKGAFSGSKKLNIILKDRIENIVD
jgi:hypothetical protein